LQRRHFMAAAGGAALSLSVAGFTSPRRLRVGVVGAGILGTSIALHLAEAGADVTLIEAAEPAAGATRNSYAWLNAFVADIHYRDLRLASLARWRWLNERHGLGITWGGYLNWGQGPSGTAAVQGNFAQLADSVAPALWLNADEVADRAPYLTPGKVDAALLSPSDGHLDPVAVTQRLLLVAQQHGVHLLCPSRVEDLIFRHGRLVAAVTSSGRLPIDRLVVAAGTSTPSIAAMAGTTLSLAHAPGILAHTTPLEHFTALTHEGPGESSFKQLPNGRLVAYDAPHPPELPVHVGILTAQMDFPSASLRRAHGERMLDHLSHYCPRIRMSDFDRVTLGFRPMPTDDRPIVGALRSASDVHVAVTHSGVTLAAILGRIVAAEVVDGMRAPILDPYRPERFG